MVQLITAKGRQITCKAVIRATNYNFLTIHTAAISRVEIDQIFDDPEETAVLTAIDQIVSIACFRFWPYLSSEEFCFMHPTARSRSEIGLDIMNAMHSR